MGILDDAINSAVPDGNVAKPIMIAVGALLAAKFFGGSSHEAVPAAPQPSPSGGSAGNAFPGNAGMANAATAGGILGGLGGLMAAFQNSGYGEVISSWISTGPNKPIDSQQLVQILGQSKIGDLARQAGVPPDVLVDQLSKALPSIIDHLTPQGRLPNAG